MLDAHPREERAEGRMEITIGCVGKPSVGKSTFFNAVTDGKVRVAAATAQGWCAALYPPFTCP